jgi:hypothetical protein
MLDNEVETGAKISELHTFVYAPLVGDDFPSMRGINRRYNE